MNRTEKILRISSSRMYLWNCVDLKLKIECIDQHSVEKKIVREVFFAHSTVPTEVSTNVKRITYMHGCMHCTNYFCRVRPCNNSIIELGTRSACLHPQTHYVNPINYDLHSSFSQKAEKFCFWPGWKNEYGIFTVAEKNHSLITFLCPYPMFLPPSFVVWYCPLATLYCTPAFLWPVDIFGRNLSFCALPYWPDKTGIKIHLRFAPTRKWENPSHSLSTAQIFCYAYPQLKSQLTNRKRKELALYEIKY